MKRHPVVLLADDDAADQELVRRAFAGGDISIDLRVVDDGEQVLDYLNQRGPFTDPELAPRPDLVILDLNMPRIDGHQVLREVRGDARFRRLPIVVLSTTRDLHDVNLTYKLGCNTFITKPSDLDDFMRVIRALGPYWFRLVRLPRS